MTAEPDTSPKKQPKLRATFFVLLVVVLITVAILLAFGLGGKLVGDYNKRFWIASTQGTANEAVEIDPHVTKVKDEYLKVVDIQETQQVNGVFEKISAGDYQYEKIDEESLGQYTINTFFFYKDKQQATVGYENAVQYLESIGYEQDKEIEASETSASLLRTFVPAQESSDGSPGSDKITLSTFTRESGVTVIIFLYQSTELPLSGIPAQGEEYTVEELKEYENKVFSGEIDSCELPPNGAIGGWYSDHDCFKEDL